MKDIRESITGNATLQGNINTYGNSIHVALSTVVVTSWSYGGSASKKRGVYVIVYQATLKFWNSLSFDNRVLLNLTFGFMVRRGLALSLCSV
jgi:hypothetical protein